MLRLVRELDDGHCTPGRLYLPGGPTFFTLERPWLDNRNGVSCIPLGEYHVVLCNSPRLGRVYWISDVPGRTVVRIHWGNVVAHTEGCLLLGLSRGTLKGERAIFQSVVACRQFMQIMGGEPFTLEVV